MSFEKVGTSSPVSFSQPQMQDEAPRLIRRNLATPSVFVVSRHRSKKLSMTSTVSLEVVSGPSVQLPWRAGKTAT